ncbi:DUF6037 family protein [Ornithobacterium rhinotracheale]|uniref:DUF6037 family protein n=1 Tax=Ornithobacterium rhinotracheale TaxID=28251 RepID=UPI004035E121
MSTKYSVFKNFKLLKKDMEEKGWIIEAFNFEYKKNKYIVLAKLYPNKEDKPKYALLKIEIIKANDSSHNIIIPVNSNGFMIDAKTLRKFFEIEYVENLGNLLQQFSLYFSNFIPTQVNPNKSEILKSIIVDSLSKSDGEDPNKIYCFTIRRHINGRKRTPFNDNKTKLLRPSLYRKLKNELTISFCYSKNKDDENTDEEILMRFSMKN